MKNKIIKLYKNKFVRNVIILASGAAGAQAIAMILSPIITRMYGPEAYGIMGTFTSIISIIAPVAALTYPISIVLPKNDSNAKGIIRLSLIITLLISITSLLIIILFNKKIVEIFNINEIVHYMYLIALVIIFGGLMEVSEQWLIRTQQFAVNAKVTILQALIINGSKIGIGLFYPFASVLVILNVLANGLKATMMIVFAKKSTYRNKDDDKSEKEKNIKRLTRVYYDFHFYRVHETFLNTLSNSLPILMLSAFFGPASAGFYSIGRNVLSMPSRLIGKSVEDVFYPRIATAANNNENITKLIIKATLALGFVGILPYGLIIAFGPYIFSLVFGSEWIIAGEYARWIALWSFFAFINRPSVRSLPVLSAQRFHLIYTVFMLVTRLGVLALGYYIFASDIIAVALFGITGAILNFGLIAITLRISINNKNKRI